MDEAGSGRDRGFQGATLANRRASVLSNLKVVPGHIPVRGLGVGVTGP